MNLYWDSCVFIRFLTGAPPSCVADINQFIAEAREGRVKIWTSGVVATEVLPRYLRADDDANFDRFLSSFEGAFRIVNPDVTLLSEAGRLRDVTSMNPDHKGKSRILGTGDAIHLATAIRVRDVFGASDLIFHTFDDGKGRNWEGKCVPMLSYERWYPIGERTELVEKVCNLPRKKPVHPSPDIATTASRTDEIAQPGHLV